MRTKAVRAPLSQSLQPESSTLRPQLFPVQAKAKLAATGDGTLGVSLDDLPIFSDQSGTTRGGPLPQPLRQRMEAAFQTSFSDVRIHQGPQADSLSALAFTHGRDVYLAPGRYSPATSEGQRIIAHELAHVVQQRSGRVSMPHSRSNPVIDSPLLEAEADRMGDAAVAGQPVSAAKANNMEPNSDQPGGPGVIQPLRKYRKREEPAFSKQQAAPAAPVTLMGMAGEDEQIEGGPAGPGPAAPVTLMGMAGEDEQIEGGPAGAAPAAPVTLMGYEDEDNPLK